MAKTGKKSRAQVSFFVLGTQVSEFLGLQSQRFQGPQIFELRFTRLRMIQRMGCKRKEMREHKNMGAQKGQSTKGQEHKDAEAQRDGSTKMQEHKYAEL